MSIIFFIIYRPTRVTATVSIPYALYLNCKMLTLVRFQILCAAFHLMNYRLFSIGMFPWVCLAELPLFYDRSWPKIFWKNLLRRNVGKKRMQSPKKCLRLVKPKEKFVVSLIILYCFAQMFLPYSHFITEGYNSWTNGIYGYSWDMMIHAWDTTLTTVEIVDHNSNRHHFLHPNSFSVNDRWTKHPDLAYQYAQCIQRNLIHEQKSIDPRNISIHFDAWSSLNSRFQQRMFDPKVDMLKVEWSPFRKVLWHKPLLQKFTSKRKQMQIITEQVLNWNNFSDVMFVADFPDQTMESFISSDLDNVTLTVLDGAVVYQPQRLGPAYKLVKDQSVQVIPGKFHRVTTTSSSPSSFMYTYLNRTMENGGALRTDEINKSIFPIWNEFTKRANNMMQFFRNIQNSILYYVNGVPMPKRMNN